MTPSDPVRALDRDTLLYAAKEIERDTCPESCCCGDCNKLRVVIEGLRAKAALAAPVAGEGLGNILTDEYLRAGYTAMGETTGQQTETHYAVGISAMSRLRAQVAPVQDDISDNFKSDAWKIALTALAQISIDSPAYSGGKFTEDHSAVCARMKRTASAAINALAAFPAQTVGDRDKVIYQVEPSGLGSWDVNELSVVPRKVFKSCWKTERDARDEAMRLSNLRTNPQPDSAATQKDTP